MMREDGEWERKGMGKKRDGEGEGEGREGKERRIESREGNKRARKGKKKEGNVREEVLLWESQKCIRLDDKDAYTIM